VKRDKELPGREERSRILITEGKRLTPSRRQRRNSGTRRKGGKKEKRPDPHLVGKRFLR